MSNSVNNFFTAFVKGCIEIPVKLTGIAAGA